MLEIGMKDSRIAEIQRALKNKGLDPGSIDGVYTVATNTALLAFQSKFNLLIDGDVGPKTLQELGLPTTWRWPKEPVNGGTKSQLVAMH